MPTDIAPPRYCQHCHTLLTRREHEDWQDFYCRLYCSFACLRDNLDTFRHRRVTEALQLAQHQRNAQAKRDQKASLNAFHARLEADQDARWESATPAKKNRPTAQTNRKPPKD